MGKAMADFYGRIGWRFRIGSPARGTQPVVVRLGGDNSGGWHRAVILEVKAAAFQASFFCACFIFLLRAIGPWAKTVRQSYPNCSRVAL